MNESYKFLAWFLGPKGEHAQLLEESMLLILRDYVHWRRNYFPGDKVLISPSIQRTLDEAYDALSQNIVEMAAELRRNFPFYSPRYIAHQLSETTLPGMIGYLAGMLYNPNNVTPEAAPVTVDWEIEACNEVLAMLGFTPPPAPPSSDKNMDDYLRQMRLEFGWAHITLGGTTANIEALWIARAVRYFPLSARYVAIQQGLEIEVHVPVKSSDGKPEAKDIRWMTEREVLLMRPNESVYLLAKFVDAIRRKFDLSMDEASERAWQLLNESEYGLGKGVGVSFHKYQPVIFVSGAAHYSVSKAADVLGIGRDNVIPVKMDCAFRVSIEDLERKIRFALKEGKIPLAVVAIVGTTEEGAVDPVHEIIDLRQRLEEEQTTSFWLHIDAAWGGFLRCLFRDADATLAKVLKRLDLDYADGEDWHTQLFSRLRDRLEKGGHEVLLRELSRQETELGRALSNNDLDLYVRDLRQFLAPPWKGVLPFTKEDFEPSLQERIDLVNGFVRDEFEIQWGEYRKVTEIRWGSRDVCSAYVGLSRADSITIDPHKLGYLPYPCGIVAFKNDRVRHFVLQQAPYITSAKQNVLLHVPPKHKNVSASQELDSRVAIDAFAPFVMEGSKPGASAAALRLAIRTIPLNMHNHGVILKSSLLAARELYEWINIWDKIMQLNKDVYYQIVPLVAYVPDTNIVTFVVKRKGSTSLKSMNQFTRMVYENFTIQAELGARQYSYAQPFFLSKTSCEEPKYPYDTLRAFFDRCYLRDPQRSYRSEGLVVLRATLMNPYIYPMRKLGIQNLVQEFLAEIDRAACTSVNEVK